MPSPRVSICLPTLDGERDLARLLPRLATQRVSGGIEIVAIDSSSSDGTRDLLTAAGARVERIERSQFGHGRTRNALACLARGEVLVFLSQDAEPADEVAVERLAAALERPGIVGAYARILPRADDDALTRRTALDAPEASDEPREFSPTEPGAAASVPRKHAGHGHGPVRDANARSNEARFNNVASAVRASVLRAIPFPDIEFGEDSAWAALALAAGHRLRFEPTSVFLHAHRYDWRGALARHEIDARFQLRVHGHRVRPTLTSLLRGWFFEMRADGRFVRRTGGSTLDLLRSPALRFAQVLGQYRGSQG